TVCAGLNSLTFEEKKALKGLAVQSMHPIAIALQTALLCPPSTFETVEEIVGKGIRGVWQGKSYYLGSASFFTQLGVDIPLQKEEAHSSILTTVYFAKDGICLAAIQLGDQIKPGIPEFIRLLFPIKTLLVSGDAEAPVAKVAAACQIQQWKSGYHPV